ncbi:MAG: hypothetical protein IJK70_07630 [Bacteroidales bacterium]|nr:hypothetical protein [Bacteroidales bacterium]
MEKTITIELDPATALDTLKRLWRPVYRATIVSYRLKRVKIESRAFFRQTILAHQRVSAFNHDLCFVITHCGPLQGPQVKKIARPTEVFLADWDGVVLVRDGKVYNYDD